MKTQAAILTELGKPLTLAELTIPALKSGQALVEIAFSGVCHTQLLEARGHRGKDPYVPHCLGHEGSGTVLDRTVVLWQTDHGYARTHTMDMLPIFTFGGGGGRIKNGQHIALLGDPATRVGLTLQQAFEVPITNWGALSNQTSKTVTELLA